MQDLNVCDVNRLVIHVQLLREIGHRNWSTDDFNNMDWLEKIFKHVDLRCILSRADLTSPGLTSFCPCSAGRTSDEGEGDAQGLAQEGANGLENHGSSKTCVS